MSASTSGAAPGGIRTGAFSINPTTSACGKRAFSPLRREGHTINRTTHADGSGSASARASYVRVWMTWNHVRSATSLAAAGLLTVGLRLWSEARGGQAIARVQ